MLSTTNNTTPQTFNYAIALMGIRINIIVTFSLATNILTCQPCFLGEEVASDCARNGYRPRQVSASVFALLGNKYCL